jgi:hypothetical protein
MISGRSQYVVMSLFSWLSSGQEAPSLHDGEAFSKQQLPLFSRPKAETSRFPTNAQRQQ